MKITNEIINGKPVFLTSDHYYTNNEWAIHTDYVSSIYTDIVTNVNRKAYCPDNSEPSVSLEPEGIYFINDDGEQIALLSDPDNTVVTAIPKLYLDRLYKNVFGMYYCHSNNCISLYATYTMKYPKVIIKPSTIDNGTMSRLITIGELINKLNYLKIS